MPVCQTMSFPLGKGKWTPRMGRSRWRGIRVSPHSPAGAPGLEGLLMMVTGSVSRRRAAALPSLPLKNSLSLSQASQPSKAAWVEVSVARAHLSVCPAGLRSLPLKHPGSDQSWHFPVCLSICPSLFLFPISYFPSCPPFPRPSLSLVLSTSVEDMLCGRH